MLNASRVQHPEDAPPVVGQPGQLLFLLSGGVFTGQGFNRTAGTPEGAFRVLPNVIREGRGSLACSRGLCAAGAAGGNRGQLVCLTSLPCSR